MTSVAERPTLKPLLESTRFRLGRVLAHGSYCEVFAAHHLQLDVPVAVKVLSREHAADQQVIERLRLEAQVLCRFDDPRIVRCLDRGQTDDGGPFIVLERLDGETLQDLLSKVGAFDELSAIHWAAEWLEGLAAVHSQGVVHRDATLRNVFVHRGAKGTILKLIDFGFAKMAATSPADAPAPLAVPTPPETVVGTARFVSPEAARCLDVDHRSDLYSVGVGLYWMLAGHDPFSRYRSVADVIQAHAYERPPDLSQFAPDVTPELERIVMRLLQKVPSDRFASAATAALVLRQCASRVQRKLDTSVHPALVTQAPSPEHERVVNLERTRASNAGRVFCPGDRCGPFEITRFIDGGGFSEVYEARDPTGLNRSVALKVLKKAFATEPKMREQFKREMTFLSRIRHPHMVTVHQAGEDEGTWWLAMELLDGLNLRAHMQRHGRPGVETAFRWARQVASAVHEAHRLGVVHRDLKPDNIFITHRGDACVLDAGLARLVLDAQRRSFRHIAGTAAYAAPEALMGLPVDSRCDIYSWGHVVFEMLCGRHAFSEWKAPHRLPPPHELSFYHLQRDIPERAEVCPECPERLWAIVQSATQREVDHRPADMAAICRAIDDYFDDVRLADLASDRLERSMLAARSAFSNAARLPSRVLLIVALPSFMLGGLLCGGLTILAARGGVGPACEAGASVGPLVERAGTAVTSTPAAPPLVMPPAAAPPPATAKLPPAPTVVSSSTVVVAESGTPAAAISGQALPESPNRSTQKSSVAAKRAQRAVAKARRVADPPLDERPWLQRVDDPWATVTPRKTRTP